MSRFRILHISDLHFCVEPNRRNWLRLFKQSPALTLEHLAAHQMSFYPASYSDEVAENAARFIYKHRGRFDIAIISGDLGTTGRAEDLMEAHGFVYAPAFKAYLSARKRPTLQGGIQLAFLLPGNHDRYKDNHGNAGCKNFELKFDQDWPGPAVRTRVLSKGDAKVAIVAADSAQ